MIALCVHVEGLLCNSFGFCAMPQLQPATDYDRVYAFTRLEAQSWSPQRLALMLNVLAKRRIKTEASWGAFDAIADLLGHIDPPGPDTVPI